MESWWNQYKFEDFKTHTQSLEPVTPGQCILCKIKLFKYVNIKSK